MAMNLNPTRAPSSASDGAAGWLWVAIVLFVVYGSLVPLDYRAVPLDSAWRTFANIRMLDLGIESRADWVANGVLYVPVGFLTVNALTGRTVGFGRFSASIVAAIFAVSLAFSVEFAQVFFPQRSVSLNDLLAECLGSGAGILLATRYAPWFRSLYAAIAGSTERVATLLLQAYATGFIALCLFPYDFLVTWQEIGQKWQAGAVGWLLAGGVGADNWLTALIARPAAEMVAAFPVGLLVARRMGRHRPAAVSRAFLYGGVLGIAIEIGQFFIASGYTQGLSVATRAAAFALAAAAWNARAVVDVPALARFVRRTAIVLVPMYVASLAFAGGLFRAPWELDRLPAVLADLRFLPFYYHYFTTEAKAVSSLVGVAGMYAPIGVLCWAFGARAAAASLLAGVAALAIETGKALVPVLRPDPTNLLVAMAAAWLVAEVAYRVTGAAVRRRQSMASTGADTAIGVGLPEAAPNPSAGFDPAHASRVAKQTALAPLHSLTVAGRVSLLAAAAGIAFWLYGFPTQPLLLAVLFTVCALAFWHKPGWIFVLVPFALPAFDLAPWSGRFFLDEFDVLVFLALAIGFARVPAVPKRRSRDVFAALAVLLVAIAYGIGTVRGLWPPIAPDANAFNNYASPYNALRVAKGALYAFALWRLWRRLAESGHPPARAFALGMSAGLAWTVAVIVVERLAFVHALDFTSDYRVTGPFSQMHTGGAYIEAFITTATPFLLLLLLQTRSRLWRAAGVLCLGAAVYALMVTFSRGGYLAFGVAVCLVLASALFAAGGLRKHLVVAALGTMIVTLATDLLVGVKFQFSRAQLFHELPLKN